MTKGGRNGINRAARILRGIAAGAVCCAAIAAQATGGAVDANGCHQSKKQGYHCHPERAQGAAGGGAWSTSTDRDQAARDQRLKRECKGRPNAGACLGYAS